MNLNMTHDAICVIACCEFGTSADHAVFVCLLVCVCARVCVRTRHMFGRLTNKNRYKHRHSPICSLIRRPDCPDCTLTTKHA